MRFSKVIVVFLVLGLAIVSTVFSILAATSTAWSSQAIYFDIPDDNGIPSELGKGEIKPLCHWTRSPFYRCGVPKVDENGSCSIPDCHYYPPYGWNKTSCRSGGEYGADYDVGLTTTSGLLGRRMECQEVHYAGNLQIAATVFLGLSLLLTLGLSALTLALGTFKHGATNRHVRPRQKHEEIKVDDETIVVVEDDTRTPSHQRHTNHQRYSTKVPFLSAALLACLVIGSVTQLLAQYFGVLGLSVNATPTYDKTPLVQTATYHFFVADSWAIDTGLSVYATTAWTSAIACAVLIASFWRLPRASALL